MRPYLQLIQKAGAALGVTFEAIVPDFIYRAAYSDQHFIMYNVDPGLNNSSSVQLASSKAATYDTLTFAGLPAVEHVFLPHPDSRYSPENAYAAAKRLFYSFDEKAVIKPDDGAKGTDVVRITAAAALEAALHQLFRKGRNAAISPYYDSGGGIQDGRSQWAGEAEHCKDINIRLEAHSDGEYRKCPCQRHGFIAGEKKAGASSSGNCRCRRPRSVLLYR
ncbi:hypothetical protein SAMN05421736_11249 [Evansella caseinilytica]|uniref:ATP-grasp domain-containing protein n=1 Tax=Evansella caseinilytica TaxID=1503961 RepID=A0A1H3SU49_9BACI|nr:hypothetical protein [Evansella caseinilytica]SDZ41633.1 hypothetical protein SAMN05421736_11249 [Evansella caseinilytica]